MFGGNIKNKLKVMMERRKKLGLNESREETPIISGLYIDKGRESYVSL